MNAVIAIIEAMPSEIGNSGPAAETRGRRLLRNHFGNELPNLDACRTYLVMSVRVCTSPGLQPSTVPHAPDTPLLGLAAASEDIDI